MHRFSATVRITLGLACLSITVLLAATTLGMIPNRNEAVMEGRAALCESIAIHCSLLASRNDIPAMKSSLEAILQRNPSILSAGVQKQDGTLIVELREHKLHRPDVLSPEMADSFMVVPIMAKDKKWGSFELSFEPLNQRGIWRFLGDPVTKLATFVGLTSLIVYFVYLRKLLQDLDPSKVVPDRVRTTLDTLAEGLLVLDNKERIVLANQSFAKTVGKSAADLQGRKVTDLPWTSQEEAEDGESFPWARSIQEGATQAGAILGLETDQNESRTFKVNSSPILGEDGESRGALASFDDVTAIENNRVELRSMLDQLEKSRDDVRRKNEELQRLASRDPLTSCLNRRSFFEYFKAYWSNAQRYDHTVSCVMVDVNHFKSINDEHGHSVGDQVLKNVASVLQSTARKGDVVCRYGGEEFCILLPHIKIDRACMAAERFRVAIESTQFPCRTVTASLGVSAMGLGAGNPQEMIDQADKCLYVAKRKGRNQVARWDEVPDDEEADESKILRTVASLDSESDVAIPFHAVTALISALAYRDTSTAEHCRRVADLCVGLANKKMSVRDAYVLENAALLHDIGKIGVPDSIFGLASRRPAQKKRDHRKPKLSPLRFEVMEERKMLSAPEESSRATGSASTVEAPLI